MESDGNIKDNEVSGPLQHLLSLKWGTLPDISTVTNDVKMDVKPLKHVKKVRFSEEIEKNYLDSYDIENNNDDIVSEDMCPDKENTSNFDDDDIKYDDGDIEYDDKSETDLEDDDSDEQSEDSYELQNCKSDTEDTNNIKNFDTKECISHCNEERNENSNYSSPKFLSDTKDKCFLSNDILENDIKLNLQVQNKLATSVQNETNNDKDIVEEMASIQIESSFSPPHTSSIPYNEHPTFIPSSENDNQKTSEMLPIKTKSNRNVSSQKQTEKINILLNNSDHNFSSVSELKSTVVGAWSTVKKKESKTLKKSESNNKSEKLVTSNKSMSKDAHAIWKTSKLKKKKFGLNKGVKKNLKQNLPSDMQQEISKIDEEEKEMVFKSWKKEKDAIMKREAEKKYREKQQQSMSLLMDEQIKKEDAQSAYLAWIAHKAENSQKEKLKKKWLMEKDKEANAIKITKDKEALEVYQMWLESKYFQKKTYPKFTENRPPWIPPHG